MRKILMTVMTTVYVLNSIAQENKFIDSNNFDMNVHAQDDFYKHCNGRWLKNNPIPPSEVKWGSFIQLRDQTLMDQKVILDEVSATGKKYPKGSNEQKIRDFYLSGMNIQQINKEELQYIRPILDRINQCKTNDELMELVFKLYRQGIGGSFAFYVNVDDKDVTVEVPQFAQAGLGLPDRDYYFKEDQKFVDIRNKYINHIYNMLSFIEDRVQAKNGARFIFDFESKLAKASMSRVDQRDPEKTYNKYDINRLERELDVWDWTSVMTQLGIPEFDYILIAQPEYFMTFGKLMNYENLEVLKEYFKFHLISEFAPYMSEKFDNENFDFYGKVLSGQKVQKDRWKRVLGTINGNVGEVMGQLYVNKFFPPDSKAKMLTLVNNLQSAYGSRIMKLTWMSDSTKKMAMEKLNSFTKKIGYPDKWKDYSNLIISEESYLLNVMKSNAWSYNENISKYGKPVDKGEWMMPPQTVNAYYNPSFNEIVFPAAILKYPFFDPKADDAVNYGGIGAVIGHEMTHGFDDQGAQYAADGNLKNWWTEEDKAKFEALTTRVVKQYDAYTVLDTVHVNGELTLGENIADLGGINIAYDAFSRTPSFNSKEKIAGFTPRERFFMSWAQIWRGEARPETQLQMIMTDPHSPGYWRCNGPLTNFDEWYQIFNVNTKDKMYVSEKNRIKIW